jgi:2-polyprenyl-3-methyl-5-hydroxy-6-metoxy-1,4-benzoquinol methylase
MAAGLTTTRGDPGWMAEEMTRDCSGVGEPQEWEEIWSDLSDDWSLLYRRDSARTFGQFIQRCYFEDLWALLGQNRDAKCLEVGAGRGTTSMYLTAEGCDVTMLDLAPQSFIQAERNFRRENLPLPKLVAADARDTGLPSDSYDCVLSIGLLEHFDDPRPVLIETLRLLKPGGLAYHVVVPAIPERKMLLTYALVSPWKLPPRNLKNAVNSLLGRKTRGTGRKPMLRTQHGTDNYVRWLSEIPAVNPICIPYNPYHMVTNNRTVERWWGMPLYRLHRAIKRLISRPPWARTADSVAMCVLVSFRKPATTG